jgi:Transport protein Avl9
LSRLPLFGYIEVKLNIIIDKIFEQENFNCEELLKESYNELNRCLFLRTEKGPVDEEIFISNNDDLMNDYYIGICLRELILTWRHKILILFKLLLLEKRVLFYGSPVSPVCKLIQSIVSLHPQLLNKGMCNNYEAKTTFLRDENKDNAEKEEKDLVEEKADVDEMDAVKAQQVTMQSKQIIYS